MYIQFEPGEKHAKPGAETSDDLSVFKDAGYLIDDNDLIVDIDNLSKNQIKEMIARFNIKTQIVWTDRGAHFYFKKPDGFRRAKALTPIGVEVEYKHKKNTNDITVKRNGKARETENVGLRESLPEFLRPGNKYVNLLGLDEGDGRNEKLFQQRSKIASLKDWNKIIYFINDTIFANPLPEKEMEQLARDIQFTAEKDGEAIIADLIMKEKRVVKFNGMLYFYDDGEYICDVDKLKRMVFEYCEGQKTRYVDEVISQMSYRTKLVPEDQTFDIKFKNGILRSGEFLEIDYTDFTPYSISSDYDPETKPVQVVDDYLNHLTGNDAEYKKVVLEMMAHCLITDKEVKRLLGKFFIMVGDGGNGKGTLLTIVRAIFNTKNCSGLSVKKMTDERYFNVLQGKLCNLGDDIEDEAINNEQMKVLKNISTCDFVEMRKLYRDATSVEMTPTLIFTSNHILKSFEKGESYKRRVVWMPMYGKVKKKDGRFISKLTSEKALKYWIKLIVEAYFELWNREKFSTSNALEEFNRKYHEENNSALEWVEELKTEDIEGRKGPEVYEEYEVWAQENGLNVQSKRQLNTTIKELLKMEPQPRKINGKTARVYMNIK